MSVGVSRYRARGRAWLVSPRTRMSLLALSVACIFGLALLKATAANAGPLASVLKVILPFAFVGLTIVDFRASVAIVVFELVLGGAGGSWVEYGTRLSGRVLLDGVVMLRALSIVVADWRRGERRPLGRYGIQALALAILIPAIWMTIGLLRGNGAGNVFGDGNGFAFFALAIVVITLVRHGSGAWFRNLLLAACATNGIATLVLIVASASHVVGLMSIRNALYVRLDMGGVIGHMGNGAFRLFTGASLFLIVGLALTAARLVARPRSYHYWLLLAVFSIDLVITYTRGLWLGGAAAFALVVALGAPTLRRAATVAGITVACLGVAALVAPAGGFSLYNYVFERASTIGSSLSTVNLRTTESSVVDPGFEASTGLKQVDGWKTHDSGAQSMQAQITGAQHESGSHSLELTQTAGGQDDFMWENLAVKPSTHYTASAWVKCVRVTPQDAGETRGLFIWEAQDGLTFDTPISTPCGGWQHIYTVFKTGPAAGEIQIRLYAPFGRVYWDDAKVSLGTNPNAFKSEKPAVGVSTGNSPIVNPGFEDSGGLARGDAWQVNDWGAQSMQAQITGAVQRSGFHSLELTETAPAQDDYVWENVPVKPSTHYTASAWVKCVGVTPSVAAETRGVFIWDFQDGPTFNTPIGTSCSRWRRVATSFETGRAATQIQIRLYAPLGRVYWDDVGLSGGAGSKQPASTEKPTPTATTPTGTTPTGTTPTGEQTGTVAPIQNLGPTSLNSVSPDVSGEISNDYRLEEAKSLFRHFRKHPLLGSGFGAIATDFATGYRYELSYLDLLYKAGIVGLLLFLSFPLRLLWDALRLRFGKPGNRERALQAASVPVAIVASVLFAGATNPYLFAAFGLFPILAAVGWLELAPEAGAESTKS
jgi:hypothetical protein